MSLALLTLVIVAFFWPLVFAGYWIPHGGGDLVSFLWPMYRFSARSLWSGEIPLWNPHLYSGAPYVADNQSGVFYPINLLASALFGEPSYGVMEGLVVFHIWLAGVTTFALLHGLDLQRPAALLGGIAFALSDLFVTHIGNLNLNATVAWLPLLLLLTHRALDEKGRRASSYATGAGGVLAVAALAGHGQMLLLVGLALVGYVVYRMAITATTGRKQEARGKKVWTRLLRICLRTALIVAVGIGGAALMLLPAREMAEHTGRGHLPYEEATAYSLPPQALVGVLAPGFYGRSATGFWGDWDRVEVGYAGVATVVLAVVGVGLACASWIIKFKVSGYGFQAPQTYNLEPANLKPTSLKEPFPAGFFALLTIFGFMLAMGRYTPLYGLLYRYVPIFDQIRVPARMIVLADLGLAALAAYGLDRLLHKTHPASIWVGLGAIVAGIVLLIFGPGQAKAVPPDRVAQATASLIVATVLLALAGISIWLVQWRRWTAWLLVGLLAIDLVALGSTLEIEPNDPTVGFQHQDVVDFLRQDTSLYRIEATAGAWQPDAALVHGLYDIDGIFNPLGLAPYHAYLAIAKGERGAPLYNLLGAKYVLTPKGQAPGDERLVSVYAENQKIDVYLNTEALPMALLVYQAHLVNSHTEAWNALFADFDPTETVILEESQIRSLSEIGDRRSEIVDGTIEFVTYGLNEIVLVVEMPADGWLVLSEVYYPGWQATVDGERTEVLRADYDFRAVALSPGKHVVRMTFTSRTWKAGLVMSGITWTGLVAWMAGELRRYLGKKRLPADLPPQQPMV
jgi:hypothetical protein